MKKLYQVTVIVLFLAMLFLTPICLLLKEDADFSEKENRYLSGKPKISEQAIRSGKFMEEVEKYIDDQFPRRDVWISLKSDFLRLIGSKEINGVYLAEDGNLIEKWLPDEFHKSQLTENIHALNVYAKKHTEQKVSLMLVPTSAMIIKERLPKYAPMFDQRIAYDLVENELNGISYIDLKSLFESRSMDDLYYKTDHHWTTYGAFLAYTAWCKENGFSAKVIEFETDTVTKEFQGSLHSKVLGNHCAYDSIELYKRKNETPYRVSYNLGKDSSDTVYDMGQLEHKDKYQVFFGGNHPEITIQTAKKNGKHLLIIKDSFANAFLPFLVDHYETIHVIDLRYYNGNLDSYIADNKINECIFLYNIKNFCEDKNISSIAE